MSLSILDIAKRITAIVSESAESNREILDKLSVHHINVGVADINKELLDVKTRILNKKELVESSTVLKKLGETAEEVAALIQTLIDSNNAATDDKQSHYSNKSGVQFESLRAGFVPIKKYLSSKGDTKELVNKFSILLQNIQLGHESSSALTEKYRSDLVRLSKILDEVTNTKVPGASESVQKKCIALLTSAINQTRVALKTSNEVDSNEHLAAVGDKATLDLIISRFNETANKLVSKASLGVFRDTYIKRYNDLTLFMDKNADTGEMSIKVSAENWLSNLEKAAYARAINRAHNSIILQMTQSAISGNSVAQYKRYLAKVSSDMLKDYDTAATSVKIAVTKAVKSMTSSTEVILNSTSSPSFKELIKNSILNKLNGNTKLVTKTKSSIKTTSVSKTKTPVHVPTTKIAKISKTKQQPKQRLVVSPALRNLKGHFTSTASLTVLMQQMLHDTIQKNMHRPNLHYQSGRFAKSVKVEGITRARDGALTAFLSYMRYPYATFEAGGKQGDKGYYPSRLINQSAREIATKLTKERFTSVTVK